MICPTRTYDKSRKAVGTDVRTQMLPYHGGGQMSGRQHKTRSSQPVKKDPTRYRALGGYRLGAGHVYGTDSAYHRITVKRVCLEQASGKNQKLWTLDSRLGSGRQDR